MFFDFDDFLSFDRLGYSFSRLTKDMHPYRVVEKDGVMYIVLNVLGVAKDDIDVEVQGTERENVNLLVVNGNTHNDVLDQDYRVKMAFNVFKKIETIDWDAKDGLMQMKIKFAEPVKPSVKINKL